MEDNILNIAGLKLLLNESEISKDLLLDIMELTIEEEINLPSLFVIKLNINDFLKSEHKGINLDTFTIGDRIKIYMGIDDHIEIMTGEVTSLDFSFEKAPVMEIRGYDRLHRLRFGTMRRSFKNMKDSDIASMIASEINLSSKVEPTGTIYPYIFQNNQSNYEFLLERTRRIGYEILNHDKEFIFRKSKENESPKIKMEYGKDFQSFSMHIKALNEGSKVELRAWDIKEKKVITSTVSKGSERTKMAGKESGFEITENVFDSSTVAILDNMVIDSDDAENIAKARYNLILKEFITGQGKCVGNPEIRAGNTIEIKGLGDRITGVYYITSTVHSIKKGVYNTSFKVMRTGI